MLDFATPGKIVTLAHKDGVDVYYVKADGSLKLFLQITAAGTLRRHSIDQEMKDAGFQVELNDLVKVDP